jgi:exopolyphosphatase / guanosine-5'-triphosphate,3'-diphosphate pyrophosphatase
VRVAAIDIGTNSTRLLVADVGDDGSVREVTRGLTITRLGEGVDRSGTLQEAPMERVRTTVTGYVAEARRHSPARILATATSAVRDAGNGPDFLAALGTELAIDTRVLTGEEEATTTFRGVTSGGPIAYGTLIVDIGGGSTELTIGGDGVVVSAESLQVGSVRLTERYLHADPPTEAELAACSKHVTDLLPTLDPPATIGVAGTITTLAGVDLDLERYEPGRVHGHHLSRDAIERLYGKLSCVALPERERILHLEPKRAPVIVAGIVILRAVMDAYAVNTLEVSDRDILHGIALLGASG